MKNKGQITIGIGIALSLVLASVSGVSAFFSSKASTTQVISEVQADVRLLEAEDINFNKRFDTLDKNLESRFDSLETLIKAINK